MPQWCGPATTRRAPGRTGGPSRSASACKGCRRTRPGARSTARRATSASGAPRLAAAPAGLSSRGSSAGDLARLDARGAHLQAARRTVHLGPHGLDVWVEAARGAAVRVRDPVTETRPLAADVADGSHAETLPW